MIYRDYLKETINANNLKRNFLKIETKEAFYWTSGY